MYYYISGKLVLKQDGFAVIDAGGIGYKIYTSKTTLDSLSSETVKLYTYLYVREDIFDLYGFASNDELSMFLELLSVSGVGPKAALSLLSAVTPAGLAAAVITNDAKRLTKAQGVGPKMAQRIILELKDKLKSVEILPEGITDEELDANDSLSEAISALVVLGYSANDARNAVSKIDPQLPAEEIVKLALKKMMR